MKIKKKSLFLFILVYKDENDITEKESVLKIVIIRSVEADDDSVYT